jgi:polyisoprenoid-binding protein YceI
MTKLSVLAAARNLAAILIFCLAGSISAQNVVRYDAVPGGGKVKIEGTSSIHDWTEEGRIIKGSMELDAAFDTDLKTLTKTPKVEVSIPVRQLKNPEVKPSMDRNMYEHLKYTNYPAITYRLLELTAKANESASAASRFEAKGELSVAGVTRTNTMPITMERVDKDKIKVTGATSLKMTDFGIKPPALTVLGIGIKTGDDVKLTFEWTAAKAEGK